MSESYFRSGATSAWWSEAVTSAMACAIAAKKIGVSVAHVEGGLRSGDWTMPEEVNRVVIDAVAGAGSPSQPQKPRATICVDAVSMRIRIFFVGNTMIDTLLKHLGHLRPPACWNELKLAPGGYCVLTLHRPANVDSERGFHWLLSAIVGHMAGTRVVFPVHPRTAQKPAPEPETLFLVFRVWSHSGYLEFNYLVKHAKGVITDSGGVTEETTVMGIPCITLRSNTERPETVTVGTNELVGNDPTVFRSSAWPTPGRQVESWGHSG